MQVDIKKQRETITKYQIEIATIGDEVSEAQWKFWIDNEKYADDSVAYWWDILQLKMKLTTNFYDSESE